MDQESDCGDAHAALRAASRALIGYALEHTARYRLLFSDPQLQPDASLSAAALGCSTAFSGIVARCQRDRILPLTTDTFSLTGLIYAALHGAIDLEIGGRAAAPRGLVTSKVRQPCCSTC